MTFGSDTAALVTRARGNDPRAWEDIVSRFQALIEAIAHAYRLPPDDVDDVAQTTWLRLYESIDRLRQPERLPGWIVTTARRECLRTRRTRARELPTEDVALDHESDTFPAPDHSLLGAEERAVLRSAVDALPDRHQELVTLLLALPRPSYAHISRRLDMAVGSIGPTRMRAIAHLRRHPEIAALAR